MHRHARRSQAQQRGGGPGDIPCQAGLLKYNLQNCTGLGVTHEVNDTLHFRFSLYASDMLVGLGIDRCSIVQDCPPREVPAQEVIEGEAGPGELRR